jgi:hypothetical protein
MSFSCGSRSDALLARGEAQRAVDFLETLAPEYAQYKARKDIYPRDFFTRADSGSKARSRRSLPSISPTIAARCEQQAMRPGRTRCWIICKRFSSCAESADSSSRERHAAEALALRGRTEAALDALEKAERDRTIYYRWHLVLQHNEIFAGFRDHPRFVALVEKIQRD